MNLHLDQQLQRNMFVMRGKFTAQAGNMLMAAIGANPVTIVIKAPSGATVVRQTVPSGHWTPNRRGTRIAYRDIKRERGAFKSVWLYSRKGIDYSFSASAAGLDLSGGTQSALEVELLIGADTYVSAMKCAVNPRATRVRCKQKKS